MLAAVFVAVVVAQQDLLRRGGNSAQPSSLLSELDHSLDTWVPEAAVSQEQRATRNARLLQKQLDAIDASMTDLVRQRAEADEKSGGKHNPALETQITATNQRADAPHIEQGERSVGAFDVFAEETEPGQGTRLVSVKNAGLLVSATSCCASKCGPSGNARNEFSSASASTPSLRWACRCLLLTG